MTTSGNLIKCLMIGQNGIGKSTFLKSFPNSQQLQVDEMSNSYESFLINNTGSEQANIEIENNDITLETCLRDTDLIINNKVIPSNSIINTCNYKVIILCFSMNDSNSFELVKSKWEIELKKNKKKKHAFILIGFKHDQDMSICLDESKSGSNSSIKSNSKHLDANEMFKHERSCSVSSSSSTSRLEERKKVSFKSRLPRRKNKLDTTNTICSDTTSTMSNVPISVYKKFAKTIGSYGFIQVSNINANNNVTHFKKKSDSKSNAYDKLLRYIIKSAQNNTPTSDNQKQSSKIPRSISSPINLKSKIISFRRNNHIELIKETCDETTNVNFVNDESQPNLVGIESKQKKLAPLAPHLIKHQLPESQTSPSILIKDAAEKYSNEFSIKSKLSRLFIGLGTYVVTCGGTHKSRKLTELKHLRDIDNNQQQEQNQLATTKFKKDSILNRSFIRSKGKKKSSWLLLSSETSLNNIDHSDETAFIQ